MRNLPSRHVLGFIVMGLVTTLLFGISPNGSAQAAVNENFNAFAVGTAAEVLAIPGIASMVSTPANSTTIQNFGLPAPFTGNALVNLTVAPTAADGSLTINFAQPQDSYNFDFLTNLGDAASQFFVVGYRNGVTGPVFTTPYASPTNITPRVANGATIVFDQMVLSSTAGHWGIDNFVTTDSAFGIALFETAGSTDVSEAGPTSDTFQIALNSAPTDDVTIDMTTNGQCTVTTPITFVAPDFTPKTVTVTAIDDAVTETSPHPCIISFLVSSTDFNYNGLPIADLNVNVTDNDTPGINVTPVTLTVSEAGASADYQIGVLTAPANDVTVTLNFDATQCSVSTNPITFPQGSINSVNVTVTAVDDLIAEASPHPCLITHTAVSADPNYNSPTVTIADVNVDILDNDTAGVTVNPPTVALDEGGPAGGYNIQLDTLPLSPVTITLANPDGQCTFNPPSVTFTGTVGPIGVNIQAIDDAIVEGGHICVIQHTITASGADYTGVTVPDVTGSITDNDIPPTPSYFSTPLDGSTLTINTTVGVAATATVDISENGTANLDISAYNVTGGPTLTVAGAAAPFTIPDGSGTTQTLTVTCNSAAPGTFNGTLTVNHNATGSPASYPVVCNVTGVPSYSSNPAPTTTLTINTTTGVAGTATVDITETGTANLNISAYNVTGGPTLTVAGAAAPFTITDGSGTTQTLTVTCNSAIAGTFNGTLTVNHNAAGGSATYPVTCNVVGVPAYTSNPAAGTPLTINTTTGVAGTATVDITETGTANLIISAYNVTGGPTLTVAGAAAPFTITDGSGATQTLTVTCNSATAGVFNGTLTVNHNAAGGSATYAVTCNVTAPAAPAYTSNPAAGTPLTINTTTGVAGTATVDITETGTADLIISAYNVTGGPTLTVAGAAAPFTITDGSGATQTLTVTCNSATAGVFNGTLTVNHNAAGGSATYAVTCNVTAPAAPAYTSNPAAGTPLTINTTTGVAGTATVDITETGTADLIISAYNVTGGPEITVAGAAAPFTITDGSGATQTLTVTCNSATAGVFNGTLTVNHNAAGGSATYAVTCNVTAPAAPAYTSNPAAGTPLTINTTTGVAGTATVDITETGTADLIISAYAVTGGPTLTVAGAAVPFTITDGSGATQTLTVTCNSATAGVFNGTLTVNHNAAGGSATYAVTCNVTAPAVPGYSSNPANGGTLTINTTAGVAGAATVDITENGTADLIISAYNVTGGPTLTVTGAAAPFTITDGSGATQTLTVTCNSATAGVFNGTLTVNHNAAGGSATYPVVCNVTSPAVGPRYDSTPLGTTAPGTLIPISTTVGTNVSATITVRNLGDADLIIGAISVTGSPQLTLNSATNFTIVPGPTTQTISILCNAASIGTFTATVAVTHNDVSGTVNPANYQVVCDVSSVATAKYSSNPAPGATVNLSTTVGNPLSTTIRVTNAGGAPLTISSVALTGSGTSQLSLVTPSNFTLAPTASQDITIQCAATANGTFTVTVAVTHNGTAPPGSPATYTVNCTMSASAAQPGYGSNPGIGSTLDIGVAQIGTTIVKGLSVFETGSATLSITVPGVGVISGANASEFSIISGSPPFGIVDGGVPVTVVIQCRPNVEGLRIATLTFATNAPGLATVSYLLTCTGSLTPVATGTTAVGLIPTAGPTGPTAIPFVPATGVVVEVKGLAVRTGPYLGATLLNVARPGTTYDILAKNSDEGPYTWYLIKVGRVTGWVSGRYLEVTGSVDTVPYSGSVFDQIDNAPDVGVRLTTNAIIDARRRPSPRSAITTTIPAGAEVIVLGRTVQERQTFWIQVSYNGVIGWIPALPVSMRGSVAALPIR